MSIENNTCDICGKSLLASEDSWTDDEQYGDVHSRCLEAKEGGYDSVEDMDASYD
jgi:hypothetical protein